MVPSLDLSVFVRLGDKITAPLRDAENTIAKASERMNKRLALSMKLAGGGAAAAGIAYGAQRLVTNFTDSIREVERAKGELATLGVQDLDAVVRKGREMQMELAGVTADAFVRASYDIKSGIISLTDQGVADMTAAAMVTAKATKGIPEQMTSLFATSYGIFKDQYAIMSDADFGNMFGAALSASVQQFKTDGAAMQQAIESAGAGAVNLGMDMTEQLTLLGMMQQQMQAGEAGTALRAFATNAAKAHKSFADMQVTAERPVRVQVLDENGQLRAMPDILADLKARYGETLDAFEAAEIKEAFGTDEAMKMINALYGQEEAVRANADALEDAAGKGADFTREMARAADNNWDASMVLMAQKFDVLKQKIGERLLPVVERLVPIIDAVISKAFEWIDANPMLVTGIGAVVVGLGSLAALVAPVLMGASALIGSWGMMSFGLTKLAVSLFSMGSIIGKLGGTFIWLAQSVLPVVSKAIMILGRALIANPIGVAIMAIAGAAYLIYRYWEPISAFFSDMWAKVSGYFEFGEQSVGSIIRNIAKFLLMISPVGWFSLLSLNGLRAVWSSVSGFLGRVLGGIWDALSPLSWLGLVKSEDLGAAWAGVTSFVSGTAGKVWDTVTGIDWASLLTLDGLRGAWASVSGFLGGVLGKAFDLLNPLSWVGIVKSEDLAGAWSGVTSFVSGTAGKVWDAITGVDWSGLMTLDGLRTAWAGVTGYLGGVLGKAFDLLSPLSWAGIVKSDDLGAAWAGVTSFVSGTAGKVWDSVTGIDWAGLLTLDGLRGAWAGITGYLGGVLGKAFDLLSPLSWLGIVKSDDLSAAWSGVTSFVSGTAGKVWDGVTGIDWAGLLTLDGLRGAWAGITGYLGGVLGKAFDLLSPLSWAGIVKSDDLGTAWAGVTSFVSGTAGKVWDGITGIEWGTLITKPVWSNWLSFSWGDVLPDWDWSTIIPALPDLKGMFGDANETIDVRLENRATNVIGQEWQEGLDLVNQYRDGLIDLEGVKARLGEVAGGGGVLFDGFEVNRAQDMLALLQEIEAAKTNATAEITNPETLLQAAQAATELETRFPAITAAANETLNAVQAVLAQVAALIQGTDYTAEGARLAKSIADGMLGQMGAVRSAAAQIAATIRNALPNSARVNVNLASANVGGVAPAIQARARGGKFGPGFLLTGEEGPELEYRTEGGFIAHNRALQGMVQMSERAQQLAAGITMPDFAPMAANAASMAKDYMPSGNTARAMVAAPALAAVAGAGAVAAAPSAASVNQNNSYSIQMSFDGATDMEEVRETMMRVLDEHAEQAKADARGLLHD